MNAISALTVEQINSDQPGEVEPVASGPSQIMVMPDGLLSDEATVAEVLANDPDAPSLKALLAEDREPSGSSGESKFADAGRDYHRPHIETATISVLLNRPSLVTKAARNLTAADFYLPEAYGVFEAILHVHNAGKVVTPAAVLWHFQKVDPQAITEWTEFVNSCFAATSNFKHLVSYFKLLKEAAAIRGGKDYCPQDYRESFCAHLLIVRLPKTRCVDDKFYQYRDGVWSEADSNLLRTEALAVMPPAQRTSRRCLEILNHVQSESQVPKDIFRGAYFTDDNGRILINAANCVIEVAPDGLHRQLQHSPDFNFTLKLAAEYDPSAKCERFLQLLQEALPDAKDREVFQCFGGYILMPNCNLETVLVCFGPGGTGKSKATSVYRNVLGDDLCGASGLDELCKSSSYSLPKLKRKMLNLGAELTGSEIEESANLKKLVSGEFMDVRQIYGAPEDMRTTCKLLFLTNLQPRFRSGTDAEARRLRIVPFNVKPKEPDIHLEEKLKGETRGVLNWMLEGLSMVLKTKSIPRGGDAAALAMENFRRNNDPVGAFIEECCVLEPKESVVKRDLYNTFADWCEDIGLSSSKLENYFFKTLHQRYPDLKPRRFMTKEGRKHTLSGIGLKPTVPELDEEEPKPATSKVSEATQDKIQRMLRDAKRDKDAT